MGDPLAAARERGRVAVVDDDVVAQIAARIQNQGQAVCAIDDARALLSQFYASRAEVARLEAVEAAAREVIRRSFADLERMGPYAARLYASLEGLSGALDGTRTSV
jgi:hypothetical protein